jgi:hypothetical protein
MIIEKKSWPRQFQRILNGKGAFDIRLADFKCKPGDSLMLREWNPKKKKYTGRKLKKKIVYIAKTKDINYWPKKDIEDYGLQILGFSSEQKK